MTTTGQPPLISVVMPTYNGAAYLEQQLDSICRQSYPNVEIIAVDDCSTDATPHILDAYRDRARLQIVRNLANLGVNANFEKAMRLAQGGLIALADQDDIWAPDKLALLAAHLDGHSLIYADSALIDATGNPLDKLLREQLGIRALQGKPRLAFFLANCIPGHAMLFRRELLEHALPLPAHTLYDQWLAFTAARLNGIAHLDQALVQYRQHSASVVNAPRQRKKKRLIDRLTRARRADKIERRIAAARNRAASLRDFCQSPLADANDKALLNELADAYEQFEHSLFNRRLFALLYRQRHELFAIQQGSPLRRCVKEAMGARYLRYFPLS